MPDPPRETYRPPYRAAALAAAVILALYAATLGPTTWFWDTSEYIATGYIAGIPHPPGNPLFVMLTRSWIVLLSPLPLTVAQRVNLFAAFTSAAAMGFYFLVAHRVLWALFRQRARALAGAFAAVFIGATAFTVWNQATVNEKTYTASVLIIAIATWLALRWRDRREEGGSHRLLLLAFYLLVLGSTNHQMSLLPAPAILLFALYTAPSVFLRREIWIGGTLLLVLGLSLNFTLPFRAAHNPVINEGHPTCEGFTDAATAIYSLGRRGCPALAATLTREQYAPVPVTERKAPFSHQLLNYAQYFDWQWARGADPSFLPGNARLLFTLLFAMLGGAGLWVVWRVDRGAFVHLGTLTVTLTLGLVVYLNFKYGYSLAPEVTEASRHEVRERDYFYVAGFGLWGVLAGIGLAGVWRAAATRLRERPRGPDLAGAYRSTAPILLVALLPLLFNWSWSDRRGDYAARDWAYDILQSLEPYAVLFTDGDNDTFPLWYLQEVEGIRKDVTVIVGEYLYTEWYPRQLRFLTLPENQRPFRVEGTPAFLAGDLTKPKSAILSLDPSVLEQVAGGLLSREYRVRLGGIVVTYPVDRYLGRGDRLALRIIRESIAERPVYFASSVGMIANLGLRPWGVYHGLVTRLVPRDLGEDPPPGLVRGPSRTGSAWFDLDRSLALVNDVYRYRGLRDRDLWADHSTSDIPHHFYRVFSRIADALAESGGDPGDVEELRREAEAFRITARGGRRLLQRP